MKPNRILVVGELNVDLILNQIQGFPQIGTEIVAEAMDFTLGSSSAILASNISSLGIATSFCGMIGKDDFGDFILQQLQDKKVDTSYIQRAADQKTGITVVMNYDQDRANVTYCGAMDSLTIDEIPWDSLSEFRHLHLSNYFLQKGIKNDITGIFRKAREAGLTTSLDLQWDPQNLWDFDYKACLPHVDVFLPNEQELLALTRESDIEGALRVLKPYTHTIALKMGEKGAMLISGDEKILQKPFLNRNFQDAIGAGDSFNAGFLQKFMEGAAPADCLRNASLMGSLSTTRAGGTAAFTGRQEIDEQIQKILNQQL